MKQQKFDLPEGDPFSRLDREIARLNEFFSGLDWEGWKRPTRCEGWTVRDMVAHFDSNEEYDEACLNDRLEPLLADFKELDQFNAGQIQKRAHLSNEEILNQWRERQGRVRRAWEELGLSAMIPTSIGPYPLHAQIWHLTSEYATHADDMGVEVPPAEQQQRIMWRCQFSAFALQERKNPPALGRSGDRMIIAVEGHELDLPREDFIAAVSGRLRLPEDPADRRVIEALRMLG